MVQPNAMLGLLLQAPAVPKPPFNLQPNFGSSACVSIGQILLFIKYRNTGYIKP